MSAVTSPSPQASPNGGEGARSLAPQGRGTCGPGRPSEARGVSPAWLLPVAGALAFRFACYAVMTAAAVWAERRPAPGGFPDLVLDALPYVERVANANYLLWLAVYLPLSVAFLVTDRLRWVRYMITGGLVSLARGLTIAVTGLGPPTPAVAGAGLTGRDPVQAWVELVSPWSVFAQGSAQAYLTQDLFFSGHTATTFLLVLYLWPRRLLRWVALGAHLLVVASVLLARLHYTVDVLGAWAVTFALFAAREWRPAASVLSRK